MIQETIVTSISALGTVHIAPMGVHVEADNFVILPFKPSVTLNNILATGHAVLNHCDDVRIFAGCLTGRRDWGLKPCKSISGYYLADTLTHIELSMRQLEDDPIRPRLVCTADYMHAHRPFQGFNRAQFAVLEAAILLSRLDRLPWRKIQTELAYLRIAVDKCAGDRELEAWGWLMQAMEEHKQGTVAS
ncbi:MAG: DUF447 family protein [Methylomonas sp.]|uniref:DUF447 domain-containing protein n=1 Tax=Methylomonas sp. TaxID=418 RepID=UPI0025F69238|nr:DUF447 domain-containing protein [Methylomonas sp.]MCK9604921.1 DUF447 family protein [Methylomonas sp.]